MVQLMSLAAAFAPSESGGGGSVTDERDDAPARSDAWRADQHERNEASVGEVRRSTTVPGFAWREVFWRGTPIGILSEVASRRHVAVCRFPCMYRTPEGSSERGIARLLLAHRRNVHRTMP